MGFGIPRLLAAVTLAWSVAGCVVDPALVDAGLVKAPAPVVAENAYVAKQDGNFSVPAIPLDKLPVAYQRQTVSFATDEAPGTIIIDPAQRVLHFVTGKNQAIRYGISVGRAGFEWSGVALVTGRQHWPKWTPPPEMIARDPKLAKWENGQPGGPTNPLGARALYLTTNGIDYGYRIHGTPDWNSIGSNASSGCIRMINQDVMDLYDRVPDGAKVIVLTKDGQVPTALNLPPPAPKPAKKAAAVVVPVSAAPAPPANSGVPPYSSRPPVAQPAAATVPAVTVTVPAVTAPAPVLPAAITPAPAAAPVILLPPVDATAPSVIVGGPLTTPPATGGN